MSANFVDWIGSADGLNIGLGAEYRWTPNLSVYAEYRYHDLDLNRAFGDADANQIKVGFNYPVMP